MGEKEVVVNLNLGSALKASVQKTAKAWGVSENEFICNALESRVRAESEYRHAENFTPHGGKHLVGKSTGYEVTADGKYYPAPLWVSRFEELFAERNAIHSLANSVIATAQERLIQVEKSIIKAKDDLISDLGLDPSKEWAYYGAEKCLRERSPDPDEANS